MIVLICLVAFVGASIIVSLARGPRETGWVGWEGGWRPRNDKPASPPKLDVESKATIRGT